MNTHDERTTLQPRLDPICSPLAVAGRRCTDMRRFLTGGAPYWRFLWREHLDETRGTTD